MIKKFLNTCLLFLLFIGYSWAQPDNAQVETKDGKKDDQINTNSKHTLWLKNVNKRKIERCFSFNFQLTVHK